MGKKQNRGRHGRSHKMMRDMVPKILIELPAKSLMRFRCVSKTWLSIINNPYFVNSHHARSYTRPGGINLIGFVPVYDYEYDHLSDEERYNYDGFFADPEGKSPLKRLTPPVVPWSVDDFARSVRGLFCVENCIWNPTINESIVLPSINFTASIGGRPFKQSYRPTYFLGFDSSNHAYKVLCIISIDAQFLVKIFELGGSSWRDIEFSPSLFKKDYSFFTISRVTDPCSIDNLIYISLGKSILTFDFRCEKFEVIPNPDGLTYTSYMIEVGQCVALINEEMDRMWILEDYKKRRWKSESLVIRPLIERIESQAKRKPKNIEITPLGRAMPKNIDITPLGSIHTGEILFKICIDYEKLYCYYYEIGSKKGRMVPELTRIIEGILHPDVSVTSGLLLRKHVESIYRLM